MSLIALKPDVYARFARLLTAYERGELAPTPRRTESAGEQASPRLRVVLLEELGSYSSGLATVTKKTLDETGYDLKVVGYPTGSETFTLHVVDHLGNQGETEPISVQASSESLRIAIEQVGLRKGSVTVGVGTQTIEGERYFPGRWLISFGGPYKAWPPQLTIRSDTGSPTAEMQIEACDWIDTGIIKRVTQDLSLDDPTPVVAGAIAHVGWINSAGYCIDAVEARRFSDVFFSYYDPYNSGGGGAS